MVFAIFHALHIPIHLHTSFDVEEEICYSTVSVRLRFAIGIARVNETELAFGARSTMDAYLLRYNSAYPLRYGTKVKIIEMVRVR